MILFSIVRSKYFTVLDESFFFIFQHVFGLASAGKLGQLFLFSFGEESLKRFSTHNIFYSLKFEFIGVGCNFAFVGFTFSLVSCLFILLFSLVKSKFITVLDESFFFILQHIFGLASARKLGELFLFFFWRRESKEGLNTQYFLVFSI
jgi:hypothetical protein